MEDTKNKDLKIHSNKRWNNKEECWDSYYLVGKIEEKAKLGLAIVDLTLASSVTFMIIKIVMSPNVVGWDKVMLGVILGLLDLVLIGMLSSHFFKKVSWEVIANLEFKTKEGAERYIEGLR